MRQRLFFIRPLASSCHAQSLTHELRAIALLEALARHSRDEQAAPIDREQERIPVRNSTAGGVKNAQAIGRGGRPSAGPGAPNSERSSYRQMSRLRLFASASRLSAGKSRHIEDTL
jgi:hypothetical protein